MTLARTDYANDAFTGGASWTTASFTPPSSSLLVVSVLVLQNATAITHASTLTITDTAGLTWTRRVFAENTSADYNSNVVMFTAPVTTGASMTVTLGVGAGDANPQNTVISKSAFTGYNTSTPTGVTGSDIAVPTTGSYSQTLSGSPASTSEVLGWLGGTCTAAGNVFQTIGSGCSTVVTGNSGGNYGFTIEARDSSTSSSLAWVSVLNGSSTDTYYHPPTAVALEIIAAGAGGTALTGQAATSAAGTLTQSRALAATGLAATLTPGTVTPGRTVALTGQAATSAAGTLTQSRALAATGLAATLTPGTVTVSGNVTLALTGLSATVASGTVVEGLGLSVLGSAASSTAGALLIGRSAALTGAALTSAAGTLTQSRAIAATGAAATSAAGTLAAGSTRALSGAAATFATGTITASTGGNLTLALTGAAATFAPGSLLRTLTWDSGVVTWDSGHWTWDGAFTPNTTLALTGQQITATRGTVTASTGGNLTLALTGSAFNGAAGTVTPAASQALTGSALTSAPGTVTPGNSVVVSGQAATSAAGTVTPSATIALLGQAATFATGTVAASTGGNLTLALTGQSMTASSGTLTPSISLTLTGSAATFATGVVLIGASASLTGAAIAGATGTLTPALSAALTGQGSTFAPGTVGVSIGGNFTIALTGSALIAATGTVSASTGVQPVSTEQPAGRRTRAVYFVTIDGVKFACGSVQEALQLLSQAKERARKLAEDQALWAVAAQTSSPEPIPVPKLYAPKIEVSSRELRSAASKTKRDIQAIYETEIKTAELRMLLEISKRQQDDDDVLSLFL